MSRVGDTVEVVVGLVVFVFIVLFIGALVYDKCSIQPALKANCVTDGGRVVDHHDGRGGWHCEGANAERAP